jgi:hypothetical protein
MKIIDRFDRMVEELKDHADVQLLTFAKFPGITQGALSAVEDHLGYRLSSSIVDVYRQSNGLQLLWINKTSPWFDEGTHVFQESAVDWNWAREDDRYETGAMILLPLDQTILRDWKDVLYDDWMQEDKSPKIVNGKSYQLYDFATRLRMCDLYSTYHFRAFFLDGSDSPPVLLADDHGADWLGDSATSLLDYLHERIDTYCTIDDEHPISKDGKWIGSYG